MVALHRLSIPKGIISDTGTQFVGDKAILEKHYGEQLTWEVLPTWHILRGRCWVINCYVEETVEHM